MYCGRKPAFTITLFSQESLFSDTRLMVDVVFIEAHNGLHSKHSMFKMFTSQERLGHKVIANTLLLAVSSSRVDSIRGGL